MRWEGGIGEVVERRHVEPEEEERGGDVGVFVAKVKGWGLRVLHTGDHRDRAHCGKHGTHPPRVATLHKRLAKIWGGGHTTYFFVFLGV